MTPKVELVEWFDSHWYKIELAGQPPMYFPSTTTVLSASAKPFLAKWRGELGNREADLRMMEAADRGSRIHNAWSIFCQGGVVLYQPFQRPIYTYDQIEDLRVQYLDMVAILPNQDEMYQMTKLERWMKAVKPLHIESEKIVYTLSNRRAGTADNFVVINGGEYLINGSKPLKLKGGLYVMDLKSGKAIDDDAYMQISDYTHSLIEMAYAGVDWAADLIKRFGTPVGGLILHTSANTRTGIEGLATVLRTAEELAQDYLDLQSVDTIWRRKNKDAKPTVFEFPSLITLNKKENENVINA